MMVGLFLNVGFSFDSAKMAEGISIALLGLAVVISALILIMVFLEVSGKLFKKLGLKDGQKLKAEKLKPKKEVTISPGPGSQEEDDAEIVAVISAAISAYTGRPVTSFKVVKFQERI